MNEFTEGLSEEREWATGMWMRHYLLSAGFRLTVLASRQPSSESRCALGIEHADTGEDLTEEVVRTEVLDGVAVWIDNEKGAWLETKMANVQLIRARVSAYLEQRPKKT